MWCLVDQHTISALPSLLVFASSSPVKALLPKGCEREKLINNKLFDFVIKSRQAISIVDNEHFKKYSAALDDRYILPTRKAFTGTIIEEKFTAMLDLIKSEKF